MHVRTRMHRALPALAAGFLLLVTAAWSQAPPATATPPAPPTAPAATAPPAPATPGAATPEPSSGPTPPGCDAPEHRQFDFWVGEWDVFRPDGKRAGGSSIRLILGGCVVLENWKGAGGMEGWSLNIYDRSDGLWHQAWVDGSGTRLDLAGGLRGRSMVLSGVSAAAGGATAGGGKVSERITWTPLEGGKVRQLWEQLKDGGAAWTVAFDGTYVPSRRAGGDGTGPGGLGTGGAGAGRTGAGKARAGDRPPGR